MSHVNFSGTVFVLISILCTYNNHYNYKFNWAQSFNDLLS